MDGIERRTMDVVQQGVRRREDVTDIVHAEINTAAYLVLDALRANGILSYVDPDSTHIIPLIPSLDQERRDLSRVAVALRMVGFGNYPQALRVAQIVGREMDVQPMIIGNIHRPDELEAIDDLLITRIDTRPSHSYPYPDAIIFMKPPAESML